MRVRSGRALSHQMPRSALSSPSRKRVCCLSGWIPLARGLVYSHHEWWRPGGCHVLMMSGSVARGVHLEALLAALFAELCRRRGFERRCRDHLTQNSSDRDFLRGRIKWSRHLRSGPLAPRQQRRASIVEMDDCDAGAGRSRSATGETRVAPSELASKFCVLWSENHPDPITWPFSVLCHTRGTAQPSREEP